MKDLTPTEAKFLIRALDVAYDNGPVEEIFKDEFDQETMEAALDKPRALSERTP